LRDATSVSAAAASFRRLLHHLGAIPLQSVAEGVIGGDEGPGVAALLDDRAAGAVGEGPAIVGPVNGIRGEGDAGKVGRAARRVDEDLVLLARELVDGERDGRGISMIMSTPSR
jgi:hypothetical protein